MSIRRLLLASTGMAATAALLRVLAPEPWSALGTLVEAQQVTATSGPDTVVLAAAGVLAWLAWAWGALGLLLTAGAAAPGLVGQAAAGAARVLLPAGLRSGAAIALGVGLSVAAPAVAHAGPATALTTVDAVPDWPRPASPGATPAGGGAPAPRGATAVPDWPAASDAPDRPITHVVAPGDCLWRIAADELTARTGRPPSHAEIARGVRAWWTTNADVIGADPDLLLPGQRLRAPGAAAVSEAQPQPSSPLSPPPGGSR